MRSLRDQMKRLAGQHVDSSVQAFWQELERQMTEQLAEASQSVDERTIQFMLEMKMARMESEYYAALYVHCQEIMHLFDLDVHEVLDVPLPQKVEIWERYMAYKTEQKRELDEMIAQVLGTSPQQLFFGGN